VKAIVHKHASKQTPHVFDKRVLRCRLWDNVEVYCRAGQATDDNMAHALCTPDN